jgi:hypothetical protein
MQPKSKKHKKVLRFLFSASLIILSFFTIFLSPAEVLAKDITSSSFIIRDPVIGTGGGYGSSASFQLLSEGDKLFTGVGSSATFLGHYGFLYFAGGSVVPPTPPPPAPSSSSGARSTPSACPQIADFNCDGLVNIIDLSILLYYYNQTGAGVAPYDLNEDGMINLSDVSIMFYYWTSPT